MNLFTIKDLENLSGIKAHTIRIWEQRYALLSPKRSQTNIRYYEPDELKKLLDIALLNKSGYRISQIHQMDEKEINEKVFYLTDCIAQEERIGNELFKRMFDMDLDAFESILDSCISARGVEKSILNVIYPFLKRAASLWQSKHLNSAFESLASEIIRRKLILGIETTGSRILNKKRVLLFLPDGESHDLGLLMIHYLLKIRGFDVINMGANTQLDAIGYVVAAHCPIALLTYLSDVPKNFSPNKILQVLVEKNSSAKLIISGAGIDLLKHTAGDTIYLLKYVLDSVNFIQSL